MLHDRQIKEIADNIKHCGDYGRFYVHKDEKKIGIVADDSDEIEAEDFEKLGYEVTIEAECDEWEDDPNYVLFSLGTEYFEGDTEYDIEAFEEKLSLSKKERLAAEALFIDPFESWLNSPYGEFSTRCEHMTESEIKWARVAFEAGRKSCQ